MDYTKAEAKQAARDCFTGLWAATTTPFDDSGALDPDALRREVADQRLRRGKPHRASRRRSRWRRGFRVGGRRIVMQDALVHAACSW